MLFLFREDYYRNEKEDGSAPNSNQAEIIVAKNRHGELDSVQVSWSGEFTQFSSLELHRSEM